MARRGRILILVALAVIVLLVLVLLGFLPQDILRRYVEKRLQTSLGAGSSIGRMHTVPGKLRTDIENLVIQGPTYRLTVPRAHIVLTAGFLFGKGLVFDTIELESPRFEITPGGAETSPQDLLKQEL